MSAQAASLRRITHRVCTDCSCLGPGTSARQDSIQVVQRAALILHDKACISWIGPVPWFRPAANSCRHCHRQVHRKYWN